jgi:hypothetical protein
VVVKTFGFRDSGQQLRHANLYRRAVPVAAQQV